MLVDDIQFLKDRYELYSKDSKDPITTSNSLESIQRQSVMCFLNEGERNLNLLDNKLEKSETLLNIC